MMLFRSVATVYTTHATTKLYSVVVKSNLRCTLLPITGAQTMESRAEMNQMRRMLWEGNYTLPNYVQVEIDGQRWQPQMESIADYKGNIGSVVAVRACDVVRVKS